METILMAWSIISIVVIVFLVVYLRIMVKEWDMQMDLTFDSVRREHFYQAIIERYIRKKLRRISNCYIGEICIPSVDNSLEIELNQEIQQILEEFGVEESERFILNVNVELDEEDEIDLKVKVRVKD